MCVLTLLRVDVSRLTMIAVTVQPFREEISRIIAIYVADGGSRLLNLSAKEKAVLLKALSVTTHPSAFRDVIATVEWTLRHQAHPNFIRWTICNGNKPRQAFARFLGVAGIVGGIVYAIIITLSSANRGWRALAFLGLFIGVATLFAAWKGMCVVSYSIDSFTPASANLTGSARYASPTSSPMGTFRR